MAHVPLFAQAARFSRLLSGVFAREAGRKHSLLLAPSEEVHERKKRAKTLIFSLRSLAIQSATVEPPEV